MPKLPTYDSPLAQRGLQPTDRGISAVEQEGRAWNSAFHDLGDAAQQIGNTVEKHYAQKDAVDVSKQSTDTFAGLTESWNQAANGADPNNPDTADKWRTDVLEPALEKIGADVSSAHGEAEAETARARLRQHFTEKTIADQSSMAGLSAATNLGVTGDILANSVRKDPSAMTAAIGLLGTSIDSQIKSHQLDAVTGARLKNELYVKGANDIARSALTGLAVSNPVAAAKALDDGTYDKYLTPAQLEEGRRFVETQSKLNVTLTEKANKDQAEGEAAAIQATTVSSEGNLTVPKDYFANVATWMAKNAGKPGATATVASMGRTMIDYGRAIMNELEKGKPAVDDPHTVEDFSSRVTLGQGVPNALSEEEVIQARANGMLSDRSYSFYKGAVTALAKDPALRSAQRELNTFLKGIKSSITKSNILMGTNDPGGDQRNLQFTQDAQRQFDSAYQKGDGSWRKLLDRNNPASLWQQSVRYQTNKDGSMENLTNSIQGSVGLVPSVTAPVRAKGESPEAYLARTGGK